MDVYDKMAIMWGLLIGIAMVPVTIPILLVWADFKICNYKKLATYRKAAPRSVSVAGLIGYQWLCGQLAQQPLVALVLEPPLRWSVL